MRSISAIIHRQRVVCSCFLQEQRLHLLELRGFLRGQIVGGAEVLIDVVELPLVFQQGLPRLILPGGAVNGVGQPAVVVNAAVAEDLEVLRLVPVLRLGIAKEYTMLTPSMGVCGVPFTAFGSGNPAASRMVGAMSMT